MELPTDQASPTYREVQLGSALNHASVMPVTCIPLAIKLRQGIHLDEIQRKIYVRN
jgi:hypothetical protein